MSTHLEIAKERFLDIMATVNGVNVKAAAVVATSQADEFMAVYRQYGPKDEQLAAPTKKGCPKCFGSGGKIGQPCKQCKGTGKVEVQA